MPKWDVEITAKICGLILLKLFRNLNTPDLHSIKTIRLLQSWFVSYLADIFTWKVNIPQAFDFEVTYTIAVKTLNKRFFLNKKQTSVYAHIHNTHIS